MERRAFLAASTAAALTSSDALAGGVPAAQAGAAARLPGPVHILPGRYSGAAASALHASDSQLVNPAAGRGAGHAMIAAWVPYP